LGLSSTPFYGNDKDLLPRDDEELGNFGKAASPSAQPASIFMWFHAYQHQKLDSAFFKDSD
jgi:hypothetical protein